MSRVYLNLVESRHTRLTLKATLSITSKTPEAPFLAMDQCMNSLIIRLAKLWTLCCCAVLLKSQALRVFHKLHQVTCDGGHLCGPAATFIVLKHRCQTCAAWAHCVKMFLQTHKATHGPILQTTSKPYVPDIQSLLDKKPHANFTLQRGSILTDGLCWCETLTLQRTVHQATKFTWADPLPISGQRKNVQPKQDILNCCLRR